jgi:UPF0716 protein FxsA
MGAAGAFVTGFAASSCSHALPPALRLTHFRAMVRPDFARPGGRYVLLYLLLLLIAVPLVEIAVFIQVGGLIGLWPTLALTVGTAFLGVMLLRVQGLDTVRRIERRLEAGEALVADMFHGLLLLVAGALLLVPGFATDAAGFALFVPPVRRWAGGLVLRHFVRDGRFTVHTTGPAGSGRRGDGRGPVIDGEAEDITPDDAPSAGGHDRLPPRSP